MNITINAVIAEIRRVAGIQPDFTYPEYAAGCFYTPDATGNEHHTRCIVGFALSNLGASDEILAQCENKNSYAALAAVGIFYDGSSGRLWVREVQCDQDAGAAWGAAVLRADATYSNVASEYPPLPID